jgi:hypothetical protein
MAMTQAKQAEPPSWFSPPLFTIGQDSRGNWVVQDQHGICGGLFVNHDAALRFVRMESGYRPHAVVMVSENIELVISSNSGISRDPGAPSHRVSAADLQHQRRIA